MKVILDDLTAKEFFTNGGIVHIIKLNDDIKWTGSNEQVYYDCDKYLRSVRYIYLINNGDNELVNKSIFVKANIGDKYYSVNHSKSSSIDLGKFYIEGIYSINQDLPNKDCWGIKNVNFSQIKKSDKFWDSFQLQRIKNGFDDSEVWNLDKTIVEFIIPRLNRFIQICEESNNTSDIDIDSLKSILNDLINYSDEEEQVININNVFKRLAKYIDKLWF